MTTIAANREEMAADSLTANEDGLIIDEAAPKIARIDGDLIGCEGKDEYIAEFLEWYEGGRAPKERPEGFQEGDFGALVLTSNGKLIKYFASCYPIEHHGDWLTLGSGQDIAAGAIAMGATPGEAVEIACRLNVWSGPPVVVEKI